MDEPVAVNYSRDSNLPNRSANFAITQFRDAISSALQSDTVGSVCQRILTSNEFSKDIESDVEEVLKLVSQVRAILSKEDICKNYRVRKSIETLSAALKESEIVGQLKHSS